MRGTNESVIVDCSDGEGLMKLGAFISRYPDICPFCFSLYPEDEENKSAHIRKCAKLAREIRDDQKRKADGY